MDNRKCGEKSRGKSEAQAIRASREMIEIQTTHDMTYLYVLLWLSLCAKESVLD